MSNEDVLINKNVLFEILRSHSKLSQAEFNRNPKYNNTHFSFMAEIKAINELKKKKLLDDFMLTTITYIIED